MSSVQKKDCGLRKSVLMRQSSFANAKCTAYAFLGSIFSKDSSFIHLLENTMNSCRGLVQKPALVLVLPAVQILCVAMSSCGFVISKLGGGVSFEKLDKFIAQINLVKSKYQSYSVQKAIKQKIAVEVEKQISEEIEKTQLEPRVENVCQELGSEVIEKQRVKSVDKRLALRVASFVSIFLVYTQFLGLVCLLSIVHLRVGFIFLLACIFYISSIVLKISFINNERICRRQQKTNCEIEAMNSSRPTQARSRSRAVENCLPKKKLL